MKKEEVIIRKRAIELPDDLYVLLSCFCDRSLTIPLNATHLRTQLETEQPWTLYKYCGSVKEWFILFKGIVSSTGTAVLKLTVGGNFLLSEFERIRTAVIDYFPEDCDVFYCLDLTTKETEPLDMDLLLSVTNPIRRMRDHRKTQNSKNCFMEV